MCDNAGLALPCGHDKLIATLPSHATDILFIVQFSAETKGTKVEQNVLIATMLTNYSAKTLYIRWFSEILWCRFQASTIMRNSSWYYNFNRNQNDFALFTYVVLMLPLQIAFTIWELSVRWNEETCIVFSQRHNSLCKLTTTRLILRRFSLQRYLY